MDETRQRILLAVIGLIFALAVVVYTLRIWDHFYRRRNVSTSPNVSTWTNATISVAMAANVVVIALTAVATQDGFGTHMSAIPKTGDRITIVLLVGWIVGGVGSGFTRISIALFTLQFTSYSQWRPSLLWTVIVLQALSTISCVIVEGIWRRDIITSQPRSPVHALVISSSCIIAVRTLGDLIWAGIFIPSLTKLRRSKPERALVISLLILPLFAIPCAGLKIYFLAIYDPESKDPMWELVPEYISDRVAEGFLSFAACVPLLKVWTQEVLIKFGWLESGPSKGPGNDDSGYLGRQGGVGSQVVLGKPAYLEVGPL